MAIYKVEIPFRLPSCNTYINACRKNKYAAAKLKRDVENDIGAFFSRLPKFENPIKIHFHWIEENQKRDLDGISFSKKFILDALVKFGKLKDDNRKHVYAFTDTFSYTKTGNSKVILIIEEDE